MINNAVRLEKVFILFGFWKIFALCGEFSV